jgi:hypothetical protein
MAQTKSSQRKRSSSRGNSSQRGTQASRNRGSNGGRSTTARRRSNRSGSTRARSASTRSASTRSGPNGRGRVQAVRGAISGGAQEAGHAVGKAASKAKTPLLASGVALAGLAGGVAIGARGMRRPKVLGVPVPRRSAMKKSTKNLASAAKDVGRLGQQMGELSGEIRRTREAMDSSKRRKSPVEVVLEGLTARRARD